VKSVDNLPYVPSVMKFVTGWVARPEALVAHRLDGPLPSFPNRLFFNERQASRRPTLCPQRDW
jgi:hypothetical protein